MPKRPVNLRLDDDLVNAADLLAAKLGTDRTDLVVRGLRRELLYDGTREFIYVLLDEDHTVRYVGKSNNPDSRLRQHIASAKAGSRSAKGQWLGGLLREGKMPQMVIVDDGEAGDQAAAREVEWIERFGTPGDSTLTNAVHAGVCVGPTHPGVNRIEITLSPERSDALDRARGYEPRASFIKRATDLLIAERGMKSALADLEAILPEGTHIEADTTPILTVEEKALASRRGKPKPATAHRPNCKCPVCKPAKVKR